MKISILTLTFALMAISCKGQTKNKSMDKQHNNPLLCDTATGICELPHNHHSLEGNVVQSGEKPMKVIYYTDPICSSCWGIEPQLRKLKLEYGNTLEIDYRMGGLLPDWSYNSGGISKPADVAHHWDEVSHYYDMPILGDVWLEDPLQSSYPPSIAFKAAQMQDKEKAVLFLREIREILFLEKKNIAKWEFIALAAQRAALDTAQLKRDYEGSAKDLFEQDLQLARELGVRGFPTMFFVNEAGAREMVYGTKPYEAYQMQIAKLLPSAKTQTYDKSWESLFAKYPTLTSKEFAELSAMARTEVDAFLGKLKERGLLHSLETKNGVLWRHKERTR